MHHEDTRHGLWDSDPLLINLQLSTTEVIILDQEFLTKILPIVLMSMADTDTKVTDGKKSEYFDNIWKFFHLPDETNVSSRMK